MTKLEPASTNVRLMIDKLKEDGWYQTKVDPFVAAFPYWVSNKYPMVRIQFSLGDVDFFYGEKLICFKIKDCLVDTVEEIVQGAIEYIFDNNL